MKRLKYGDELRDIIGKEIPVYAFVQLGPDTVLKKGNIFGVVVDKKLVRFSAQDIEERSFQIEAEKCFIEDTVNPREYLVFLPMVGFLACRACDKFKVSGIITEAYPYNEDEIPIILRVFGGIMGEVHVYKRVHLSHDGPGSYLENKPWRDSRLRAELAFCEYRQEVFGIE